MNEILETALWYVGLPLGAYTTLLLGAQAVQTLRSERITSQDHLNKIVDEEAHNLGMDRKPIDAKFFAVKDRGYSEFYGARCRTTTVTSHGYSVEIKILDIKEGWGASRGAVRHELYHLKHHFPLPKNPLVRFTRALFHDEPTATLHGLKGKER